MLAIQVSTIQNLWSIVIIMGIAVVIPMILSIPKLKFIPSLVLEIIVGLVLGLALFDTDFLNNFFTSSGELQPVIEILYTIGMAFVLFLSGIDMDFSVFKKGPKGEKHFHIGLFSILCLVLVIGASYGASYLFVSYITTTKTLYAQLLLTIAFSSTFASLVIPVIKEKGFEESTLGKILSTYATLSELLSIVGLSVIMILFNLENDQAINYIGIILFFILIIGMVVIKLTVPLEKLFNNKLKGVTHLATRVIILILMIAVLLADLSGVEYILGAFLVGFLIKAMAPDYDFEAIEKIGFGFFEPIFYILLGIKLGIGMRNLGTDIFNVDNLLLTLMVLGILIIVKIPLLLLYIFYPSRTTIPSALITTSTVIVAIAIEHLSHTHGIFNSNLVIILIFDSVLTCLIPPLIFGTFRGSAVPRKKYLTLIEGPEYREEDFMPKPKKVKIVENTNTVIDDEEKEDNNVEVKTDSPNNNDSDPELPDEI